ncbi:hypothetical protein B9Z55_028765 [Caenorhabditis nigoni]|uniref:Uncharacterized protein n=1 Tax=Caenorhabditis nigoni TaxID=1611254 RepID=A0A2G5SA05_9PELO|nr:hypothetical protein B9Z55_028765 [Caenorhabditis nigoni]
MRQFTREHIFVSAGPSSFRPSSSNGGRARAPHLDANHQPGPPPPPAPIAEPLEAPQLDDNDVDAAIKEELGPGSWPRLEVTEEQKREAGQLMRHTAEMKRRSLAAKKKLKAIQEEMNRERAMEAKEQEERTQKKIVEDKKKEEARVPRSLEQLILKNSIYSQ